MNIQSSVLERKDQPKNDKEVLHILSLDSWAHITPYLFGEAILRLKMTGSKSLWGKLSAQGVVKSIKLGSDHITFRKWPACLNELPSILEFGISNGSTDWFHAMRPRLNQLPSTIRKLELRTPEVNSFFVDSSGLDLFLVHHLPFLEELRVSSSWKTGRSWIGRMPSSLTVLACSSWDGLMQFPVTITDLEISNTMIFDSTPLPPGLTRVKIRAAQLPRKRPQTRPGTINTDVPRLLQMLPSSITAVDVAYGLYDDHLVSSGLLERTSLSSLSYLWHLPSIPKIELLQNLASLTELKTAKLPPLSWEYLPCTLTCLDIGCVDLEDVERCSEEDSVLPLHNLPSNLKDFSIGFSGQAEICNIQIVPCRHPSGRNFPLSLTRLAFGELLSSDMTKLLPSSITHLEGSFAPSSFKHLPSRLVHFVCNSRAVFKDSSKNDADHYIDDSYHFKLKSLQLRGPDLGSDLAKCPIIPQASDELWISSPLLTEDVIPLLNPQLTVLSLTSSSFITGECFKHLPRTLTKFEFGGAEILGCDIADLPRSLVDLQLDSAVDLTDSCVPYLPKGLTSLRLPNSIFTFESFKLMPPLLKSPSPGVCIFTRDWCYLSGRFTSYDLVENPRGTRTPSDPLVPSGPSSKNKKTKCSVQ